MKKEETPILEPSFSSCLDQARNILFPNIFLKKKEEISGLEENFHLWYYDSLLKQMTIIELMYIIYNYA